MNLIALQVKTSDDFQKNLEHLKKLILECENDSIILAPEIALSGFCYDRMEEAAQFSIKAIEELKMLSIDKTIALTFIGLSILLKDSSCEHLHHFEPIP